jgi:hypothetical protein
VKGPDQQKPPEKATQGFLKFLALSWNDVAGTLPRKELHEAAGS